MFDESMFMSSIHVAVVYHSGHGLRLRVTRPCPRCVMTTLSQGDLLKELAILRTAAHHNQAIVGVYADVLRCGTIRRGDPVRLE